MQNFESLTRNGDFLRLYNRGKSEARGSVVVYAMRSRRPLCRVGITTSKKIGNAVERNRSRRVIRAAWSNILREAELNGRWDFVFVARNKTKFLKSTVVQAQMLDALRSLGAVK